MSVQNVDLEWESMSSLTIRGILLVIVQCHGVIPVNIHTVIVDRGLVNENSSNRCDRLHR